MKKILLVVFAFMAISSCRSPHTNGWTKEYEQEVYNGTYSTLGNKMKDTQKRKQFALYIIEKMKAKYPNGLESVQSDSLISTITKISLQYTATHYTGDIKATIPWDDFDEAVLKKRISNTFLKKEDKDTRDKYCDCCISKLKYLYPDSISTPLPDSILLNVLNECKVENSMP